MQLSTLLKRRLRHKKSLSLMALTFPLIAFSHTSNSEEAMRSTHEGRNKSSLCDLVTTTTATNVSCNGGSDGSIDLTVTGGTAPYTYDWGTAGTTEDLTGLAAGTYSCTITDAGACTTTATVTINEPSPFIVIFNNTDATCNGGTNGTIDMTVAGGTAPYLYDWGVAGTTEDLTALTAGTYACAITDANGCLTTASTVVNEPAVLATSFTVTDLTCNGNATGAIDLTVAGGTAPYTYDWGVAGTTEDLTTLSAGTYTCAITDANGCTATVSITVNEPAAITATFTTTEPSCNGGTNGAIDLTVAGGTAPYTYDWGVAGTTEDLTTLSAGTYTCAITDANGCTVTVSTSVNEPALLAAIFTTTEPSCNGGTNGAIDMTVTGGTTPYTYDWGVAGTTEDLSSIAAGTYTCAITDANGCTATVSTSVNEPALLAATTTTTDLTCNGNGTGAVDLTVTGGTTPYTYDWGVAGTTEDLSSIAAGTYTCAITDANGCTATVSTTVNEPALLAATTTTTDLTCNGNGTGAVDLTVTGGTTPYTYDWGVAGTTEDLSSIAAGTYTCAITDANGCTATVSTIVNEPAAITATFVETQPTCNGGTNGALDMTVANGTAPYTFDWGSGITTEDLSSIAAGTYTCVITDANGCSVTVSTTVNEPALLAATATTTDLTCNGNGTGAVDLTVSGGTSPYTYDWGVAGSTEDLSSLAAGTYTCVIADANNCTATVTATVNEPTIVAGTTSVTQPTCNGGNGDVDMLVTGGSAPYTYAWSNGMTTQDLTAIAAGTYTCTITDANGCTGVATATIIDPAAITSSFNDEACGSYTWNNVEYTVSGPYEQVFTSVQGCDSTVTLNLTIFPVLNMTASDNGSLLITASAASTYQWINCANNTPIAGATSATFAPTANGSYAVIGTSANGCTDTSDCVVIDYVGVNEHAMTNLNVYPNPTNGNVTIAFDHAEVATLIITDAKGAVVNTQLVQNGETVSIENLENGIYFFSIQQANNRVIQRIVKQ